MRLVKLPGTSFFINPEFVISVEQGEETVSRGPNQGKSFVTVRLTHQVGKKMHDHNRSISPGIYETSYDNFSVNVHDRSIDEVAQILVGQPTDLDESTLDALMEAGATFPDDEGN
jgi:hypothetical protein